MSLKPSLLCAAMLLLSLPVVSRADVIINTFPEVNNNFGGPYPGPATTVGTVNYAIPVGQTVTSATLSGVFGQTSQFNGSSAEHELLLDSVLVGSTLDVTPDPYNNVVPFSFNVSDISVLQDGSATLSFIQTTGVVVRLSETTLTINTSPADVPEPGSVALLAGMGVTGAGLLARRRKAALKAA